MEELKKPIGWPEEKPFPAPTVEEIEKAVQEGEEELKEKDKIELAPEMVDE